MNHVPSPRASKRAPWGTRIDVSIQTALASFAEKIHNCRLRLARPASNEREM